MPKKSKKCRWEWQQWLKVFGWNTSCYMFTFICGKNGIHSEDNFGGISYCPYCGRKIEVSDESK